MSHPRSDLLVLLTLGSLILVAACTNLQVVRDWSKTSLEATQYNELVTTYANTPERLKRYDPTGPYDDQILLRKKQADALKQILITVSDYMGALATLSADCTIDYNKNVDSLTAGIKKLNAGVSEKTLGAVGSLAKDMLGATLKAYQAKQIEIIIGAANTPLQTILKGELRTIVAKDFRRDIETEKNWIDRHYNGLLQTGTPSAAAREAIQEWKEVRLEQNARRLKAVDAYVTVLDKVAEGHQKLYDNRNKLDAKELIKDLSSLVLDLRKQIRILAESSLV